MNLLAAILYDPAVAGSASTASLLAMTAIDTTNLRHTFTVPAHGKVFVRMAGTVHGGAGASMLLFGILDGSTVKARVPLQKDTFTIGGVAWMRFGAEFTISGLTPGEVTWDAAYGVENAVASSAIKYGGPDDTTGANAFGGFLFEVWDPQPQATAGQLSVDANGRVDVIKVAGTTQTAGDIPALVTTVDTVVDAVQAKTDNLPSDPADQSLIIAATDAIIADTEDIQARLPAALVGGRIDATIDATGMEAGAVANILNTALTESYAADGAAPTLSQALLLTQQSLHEFAISGVTRTVYGLDGATPIATFTLDSATAPTATTRAT